MKTNIIINTTVHRKTQPAAKKSGPRQQNPAQQNRGRMRNSTIRCLGGMGLLLLSLLNSAKGQDTAREETKARFGIAVLTKAYGDSVVIRWAPTDPVAWILSKKKGYSVYKVTRNGIKTDTTLLTKMPLKPQSLAQLNQYAASKNKYVGMAAQALYSKNFAPASRPPGSFLEEVQQQKDASNLRFFVAMQAADMSKLAADVLALRFVDRKVNKEEVYTYIVSSDTSAQGFTVMPGLSTLINTAVERPIVPEGLEGLSNDRLIELHWFRHQVGGFTYFYIERSDDGGKTYHSLTPDPYFSSYNPELSDSKDSMAVKSNLILARSQVFMDSVPENYKDYYYRIAGIDAFGDLSEYSMPVKAHGVDKQPPAPVIIDSVTNIFGNQVLITWNDDQKPGDLAGYFVAKGSDINGPFEPIHKGLLPVGTSFYMDSTANTAAKNLYVVGSIDTAGNYSYSIPRIGIMNDNIPPAKPEGLVGIMDSLGLVGLQWNIGTEEDLEGYRIYSSYDPVKGFLQVTKYMVMANTFIDSISVKSLNRAIYYKIKAVDSHGNSSEFSDVVKVKKRVLIPPTAPIAKSVYIDQAAIVSVWNVSYSEGVTGYEVFRKRPTDLVWTSVGNLKSPFGSDEFIFRDTTATPNESYQYTAESIDLTGIRSEKSFAVAAKNTKTDVLPAPEGMQAKYLVKEKKVELSWQFNVPAGRTGLVFQVYRRVNNGPLNLFATLKSDQFKMTDATVKPGVTYSYAVGVRQSGSKLHSTLTKETKVTVKN